jgi:predicted ABC-type ATPase
MFAGPNGSGKTSLVRGLARDFTAEGLFQLHRYINADDIATDLREGRGVSLDDLGHAVTGEQIREALRRGGRLQPDHPFLNTLEVVNARLVDPTGAADAYVAAAVADFIREELFAAGRSFSFETVMSHRSKTDFFA